LVALVFLYCLGGALTFAFGVAALIALVVCVVGVAAGAAVVVGRRRRR
jgi:hypothetical protein